MQMSILSKDTLVPLGLVIALAGWAFSLGIQTQKIENLREDMQDMKEQIAIVSATLNQVLIKDGSIAQQ